MYDLTEYRKIVELAKRHERLEMNCDPSSDELARVIESRLRRGGFDVSKFWKTYYK
jgi:hypothetical protein